MPIQEFVIVPSVGHSTADGLYSRGHIAEDIIELEVVDKYVRAIADELDNAGVRHRVMQTRKPPGIPEDQRHLHVNTCEFVLHCSVGWSYRPPSKRGDANISKVYFALSTANPLAVLLSECLGHWGQIYGNLSHRAGSPVVNGDELLKAGYGGIRIEPFVINGHDAKIYTTRLEQLGRDVGRTISDFVFSQSKGARLRQSLTDESIPKVVKFGREF